MKIKYFILFATINTICISCNDNNKHTIEGCNPTYRYFSKKIGKQLTPPNIKWSYFDHERAIECAKKQNKPILFFFTGHGCIGNNKKVLKKFTSDKNATNFLNENFIFCSLFADDKTKLPTNEQYLDSTSGKWINTTGRQAAFFQINEFEYNTQPFFVATDPQLNILAEPKNYSTTKELFLMYQEALEKF